jgi:3-(3-hydroxy-phenyl)propionate hydroxylase
MASTDCDILVVGGGPTGVTLGLLAAQASARVIVCEKEADIYPLPRAAHIDHEVMRIYQAVGAANEIATTCRTTDHYDFLTANGEILLRFEGSARLGQGGWPGANMIHQPSVERALGERLKAQPLADLRRGWTYLSHAESDRGVTARFATDQGERSLHARYLVGADGARSPVGVAAGMPFDDLDFDEPWLVIDVLVHDPDRLPKVNLQICDPARPTTCVLMGAGRHRWEFMLLPGETAEQVSDDAFIAALLKPWKVEGAVTVERKAVYRFSARVARTWRRGRVLLAGDAAHQSPPFAGQGMCAGARDAANLGWKLALAATDRAGDELLDTYQTEREPHVRATIGMAIMMGRTVCITDATAAAHRDAQMLAARAAGQAPLGTPAYPDMAQGLILAESPGAGGYFPQFVSLATGERLDDVMGGAAWLLSRRDGPAFAGLATASLEAPHLKPFVADIGAWLDCQGVEAVLVRADRYVFGTGRPVDLLTAWTSALKLNEPSATA